MNHTVTAYLIYLSVAVAMTVWVARTLHKNGRVFLVQAFRGKEDMADSVNHLLVVGFYLINIGYVTLASLTSELDKGSQFRFHAYFEWVPPMAAGENRTEELTAH